MLAAELLITGERFKGKKILFITGERREESANRSKYNQLEAHACDRRYGKTARLVDARRPVLHWTEEEVWEVIERHRIPGPSPLSPWLEPVVVYDLHLQLTAYLVHDPSLLA